MEYDAFQHGFQQAMRDFLYSEKLTVVATETGIDLNILENFINGELVSDDDKGSLCAYIRNKIQKAEIVNKYHIQPVSPFEPVMTPEAGFTMECWGSLPLTVRRWWYAMSEERRWVFYTYAKNRPRRKLTKDELVHINKVMHNEYQRLNGYRFDKHLSL